MKLVIYLIFFLFFNFLPTPDSLAQTIPSTKILSNSPIPAGIYDKLTVNTLKIKENATAPINPCLPGQLYNWNGVLNLCGAGGTWGNLVSEFWTLGGTTYIYPNTTNWNVGIGNTSLIPPQAKLEIYKLNTAPLNNKFTDVDVVEGNSPLSRWSLRSYYNLSVAGGLFLTAPFVIDNNPPANPALGHQGSLIITKDGAVNIVKNSLYLPLITNSPLFNVQTDVNAISGTSIDYQNLAATFTYNNPGPFTGKAVGIGFGVASDTPNNIIHGAIAVENVTNGGRMHFGTIDNSIGGNLPLAMTITEEGWVSIGDTSPVDDAHLLITRKATDSLPAATLTLQNIDVAATEIGTIRFQRGANFTNITVTAAEDVFIRNNNGTDRIQITSSNNLGTIAFYDYSAPAGSPPVGYFSASPDNTMTLRGKINSAGTLDLVNGSGGLTAIRTAVGKYTITFTSAFLDIPVANASPISSAAVYTIPRLKNIASTGFEAEFYTVNGVATDTDFNFIVTGKR